MKQTGKIAVGKVVLRDREDLVALFPHDDGLLLQKLRYPHELREMKDVPDFENVQKLDARETEQERIRTRHHTCESDGDHALRDRYRGQLFQRPQNPRRFEDSRPRGYRV